jgi:predicted transcriptional regulator
MNKPVPSSAIPVENQAAFRAAVREGIDAADAGRLTPFEPVAEWLGSWGTENELPAPE